MAGSYFQSRNCEQTELKLELKSGGVGGSPPQELVFVFACQFEKGVGGTCLGDSPCYSLTIFTQKTPQISMVTEKICFGLLNY